MHYRKEWIRSGARDNGVAYSTFYNRVRYGKKSAKEAARPPRNQRDLAKLSCFHGQPRDKNSLGFRPLEGDGKRFSRIVEQGTDTKQDLLALILREWLDRQEN